MLSAGAPKYTIEARFLPDYNFLAPVHVNGAGPFWCSFDSGGSHVISLDSAIAERAGLNPTGTGYSAGVGPEVVGFAVEFDRDDADRESLKPARRDPNPGSWFLAGPVFK
jgi:hypothetical protein